MRYNYRLRPGAVAERALVAEWHRCRYLWNEAVHLQRTGRRPTWTKLGRELTTARARNVWLRDGSSNAQQMMLRDYALALKQSFRIKGRGRPVEKKRNRVRPSLSYTRNGFALVDGRLRLPKGVIIPIVWSRELPSTPSSVRIYRDSVGHWYASFVVRCENELLADEGGSIGIDWGVTTTATTTDPAYDLPFGGHRRRCAAELAKAQRRTARRGRPRGHSPSGGYRHARLVAARLHKKAARQNIHAARIWVRKVVQNHRVIAVEDFHVRFLARSTMARKAADAAIATVKQELIYRGTRAGRKVVLVPPAYTTMTCSSCFARAKQRLGLAERTFLCAECGYTEDRDRNAARVILAVAERNHAGVDGVRHPTAALSGPVVGAQPEPGISQWESH